MQLIKPTSFLNYFSNLTLNYLRNIVLSCTNMNRTVNPIGRGNSSPAAEHNFWKDPEAAYAVLNGLQRKATVIPYETCLQHAVPWVSCILR